MTSAVEMARGRLGGRGVDTGAATQCGRDLDARGRCADQVKLRPVPGSRLDCWSGERAPCGQNWPAASEGRGRRRHRSAGCDSWGPHRCLGGGAGQWARAQRAKHGASQKRQRASALSHPCAARNARRCVAARPCQRLRLSDGLVAPHACAGRRPGCCEPLSAARCARRRELQALASRDGASCLSAWGGPPMRACQQQMHRRDQAPDPVAQEPVAAHAGHTRTPTRRRPRCSGLRLLHTQRAATRLGCTRAARNQLSAAMRSFASARLRRPWARRVRVSHVTVHGGNQPNHRGPKSCPSRTRPTRPTPRPKHRCGARCRYRTASASPG